MTDQQKRFLGWIIVVIAIIAAGFLGVTYPIPAPPDVVELGTTNMDTLVLSADLTVGDDATITDDISVGGDLTIAGVAYPSSTDLTLTAGLLVTPTYTTYHLDSTGAVSMTLGACVADGQFVWLYGDDANTITVNDTNIRSTDGNAVTLGQYDVVGFVCMDTEWNHVSKSGNS